MMRSLKTVNFFFTTSLFIAVFSSFSLLGKDLTGFSKRFEFVRSEDGTLEYVLDHSISIGFSLKTYLDFIKTQLQHEQSLMKNKGQYDQEILTLFAQEKIAMEEAGLKSISPNKDENSSLILDSLRSFEEMDFDKIFSDPKFNEIFSQFEIRLADIFLQLDPRVLAHVKDQDFFYNKRMTQQALTWALNFAKKRLSQIPILNTASFVLVKIEELLNNRRLYHQNLLLHYLESFKEDELGLDHKEVNHIMSSIFESRISWFAFWESRLAKSNWDQYGTNRFYSDIRYYNNRYRRLGGLYTQKGERLNYAFHKTLVKDQEVVLNLVNTENMFTQELAISYYPNEPMKVARKRFVIQMAELGLSFLPLPSFLKSLGESYMKSFYETQVITEGALYGHFEATGNTKMLDVLRLQSVNPFDLMK